MTADKSPGAAGGPQPGERPSREERDAGFYDVLVLRQDSAGHSVRVGVKGDRDPGYGLTSKLTAEAAVFSTAAPGWTDHLPVAWKPRAANDS